MVTRRKYNWLWSCLQDNCWAIIIIILPFLICTQGFSDNSWMLYDDAEVAVVEITINPDALDWIYQWENRNSDSLHRAQVRFKNALIDEYINDVGFRLRGNTSRDAHKKSFKLSFNTFVPGRQFYGVDKLNLNGEHNDPAIIRSKLCWDLYADIGMTASRAAHIAVYINGEYYGLYISVEHIDDEFIENIFKDDSGNLWKCLYPADLTYRGPNASDYHPFEDDDRPYELKTNTEEYDYSQLARLIDLINNTPDDHFADTLESIIRVPQVLKYLAMNVLTGSWDDYWSLMNNYYLYYEPEGDIFHFIPYDYDNTFGINWFEPDWTSVDPYQFDRVAEGERPLADRIMQSPRLRNLYTHFLKFYSRNVYKLDRWEDRMDSLKTRITPWAEADDYRTLDYGFTVDDFHNAFSEDDFYFAPHVRTGIKQFVRERYQNLQGQLTWVDGAPSVYKIDYMPQYPTPDDSIKIVAAVFSYESLDEVFVQYEGEHLPGVQTYAMRHTPVEETKIVEDNDRWTATLPPPGGANRVEITILAKNSSGDALTFPTKGPITIRSRLESTTALVINEFLAINDGVNQDGTGAYEDWVELYNPTQESINLGGMYFTDELNNLQRWQFPNDAQIGPGQFLLIWCDDDTEDGKLHTSFKLDGDGEFIALIAHDGITIIDSISFSSQKPDTSFGRLPDGSDHWKHLSPSPERGNSNTTLPANPKPKSFSLQAYPNPFNQWIQIEYVLQMPQKVRLFIYDVAGRLVWQRRIAPQQTGKQFVRWNGKNQEGVSLSSGIYWLRLQTESHERSVKILLIK
ncbi:MAG: T9SS type A sorting domain-containing protein [Caldithrix sp.]|nr:T9SS type A sorting domain-containing protein [Caldithrix sp.]